MPPPSRSSSSTTSSVAQRVLALARPQAHDRARPGRGRGGAPATGDRVAGRTGTPASSITMRRRSPRRPVERRHHQVQVDGERVHHHDLARLRADQPRGRVARAARGTGARAARLEVALDAEARPVVELLLDQPRAPPRLQAERVAGAVGRPRRRPSAAGRDRGTARAQRGVAVVELGVASLRSTARDLRRRVPRGAGASQPQELERRAAPAGGRSAPRSRSVSDSISAPGSASPSGNG